MSSDVLRQFYQLDVRAHLDYDALSYHLPSALQCLLSVQHGEEQTQTRFMKNLMGKSFIIGDGMDANVTFKN